MASGSFVTVKLMRQGNDTPWGFRLQGGKEFQMPLSMVKVSPGSLAEQAGVQVGDIIVKINGQECDGMRHKEAQDAIIGAGNYLELYLERGPMNTWRPTVTPVGPSIPVGNANEPQTYTKTSLAKNPNDQSYAGIGTGHNTNAKPFGTAPAPAAASAAGGGPKLVHKQFNSPINLYSEKSLEETLNAHTQVLSTGVPGINFMRPDAPINKDSAVYQMVLEEEARKAKGISGSPEKNGFHSDSGSPAHAPIKHVDAPKLGAGAPAGGPETVNRNICSACERLIVGVFVRINNKSLHAECFVCATCGTSLKNMGYYNINDKLYCDIHARQIKAVLGEQAAAGGGGFPSAPLSDGFGGAGIGGPGGRQFSPPGAPGGGGGYQPTNVPPQTNSYQPPAQQNGFQTFNSAPKKFSPVTAPKPFTPNRNSMIVNQSYQSQETHTSSGIQPSFQPVQTTTINSAANFGPSSLGRAQGGGGGGDCGVGKGQQRPMSCYSSIPAPAYNTTVTTNTYESRTTTNYGPMPVPGLKNFNAPPANNNANYPKTATTFASSQQQMSYSVPPPPSAGPAAPASGIQAVSNSLPSQTNYPATGNTRPWVNSSSSLGQQQQQTMKTTTTTMTDSRSAPKRGKGQLQTQLTGGVIPFCGYCNQAIRGQYIMALNKTWCPNHFICANNQCKRSLEENGFVEEQGRLYCENCYENHFAPNCTKCHQRIKGDCLNALNKQWHPECFTCAYCRKPFGNSSFYLEDGAPYCEKDWNDLFTTKCVGCGYPIAAGDRWVEALNQNYHSNCFRCTVCGGTLEGQSFFAKGGRPYCKAHAR